MPPEVGRVAVLLASRSNRLEQDETAACGASRAFSNAEVAPNIHLLANALAICYTRRHGKHVVIHEEFALRSEL